MLLILSLIIRKTCNIENFKLIYTTENSLFNDSRYKQFGVTPYFSTGQNLLKKMLKKINIDATKSTGKRCLMDPLTTLNSLINGQIHFPWRIVGQTLKTVDFIEGGQTIKRTIPLADTF